MRVRLAVSTLVVLAACGGGGSSPPPAPTRTISGTAAAAAGQLTDVDVADPNGTTTHNDSLATAQVLPSAITVGGHADSADVADYYRVRLAAGQTIALAIADPTVADLDLGLLSSPDGALVDASTGPLGTATESLTVAAAGEYYVLVESVETSLGGPIGASSYLLTLGTAAAAAEAPPPPSTLALAREFVPGEVLVRFRGGLLATASTSDLAVRAAGLGLPLLGGAPDREVLLSLGDGTPEGRARALATLGAPAAAAAPFRLLPDAVTAAKLDTLAAVKALRGRADVESADPNYVFHPAAVPADQHYGLQWHYPLMNLPQAWDVTTGAPASGSVVVAVVDTGVFLAHPDLSGKLVNGFDFISDPARARDASGIDSNPDDPGDAAVAGQSSFHGTHVAGTVGAQTNGSAAGGSGVAGVSWAARIMPIRALGLGGGTSFDILNGLRFAAGLPSNAPAPPAQRADVINLSIGCLGCFSQTEQTAYTQVRNAGVIVVAAAGNENSTSPSYPASYAGVVSVAAVDIRSLKAPYSNSGDTVDVAAPGGDVSADRNGDGYPDGVLSTIATGNVSDAGVDSRRAAYSFLQGTSMASPHVAGVAALMKANCPSLTPASLDTLITTGAITTDLGTTGRDAVYGYGLVDARKAVTACAGPAPTVLGVSPTRLDTGTAGTSFTITTSVIGPGTLAAVTASETASWLTVTPPAAASGIGAYAVTVDRSGVPDGNYAATISFRVGGAPAVDVAVTMSKGVVAASTGVGFIYVLLVDQGGTARAERAVAPVGGRYAFTFSNVPEGAYRLVAGTDQDNDNFICDAGEACGAWPTLGVASELPATGDLSGLDFVVGFDVGLSGLSAGPDAAAPGWWRLPAPKALGGAR